MPTKDRNSGVDRWNRIDAAVHKDLPHVRSFFLNNDQFGEIRLKARDDGTVLAIAKGYGSDGGPIVCFGVGYDVVLALMAIDKTIQGNHWRVDKPWSPGKG